MAALLHKLLLESIDDMPALPVFFQNCQRAMRLSPQNLVELNIIADEVVSNIFLHNSRSVEVLLMLCKKGRKINLRVEDTGKPFDFLRAPEVQVDLPLKDRQIGGLGILLIRRLSDEIRYCYDCQKNRLTIIKQIH